MKERADKYPPSRSSIRTNLLKIKVAERADSFKVSLKVQKGKKHSDCLSDQNIQFLSQSLAL